MWTIDFVTRVTTGSLALTLFEVVGILVVVAVLLVVGLWFLGGRIAAAAALDMSVLEEHVGVLESLAQPGIKVVGTGEKSGSWIGGLPTLPEGVAWPEWEGKPLAFLCQLDLGEIPDGCERQGLPESGVLYFFYDQEQSTWGFDPKDEGSWRVIHAADVPAREARREAPEGLDGDYLYMELGVGFEAVTTYPAWGDERVMGLELDDDQAETYCELCMETLGRGPMHHMCGYPQPVQGNDMELECQLVTNGLNCGGPSGYNDPRAKELEAGKADWVLLLQLDSDDEAGMMWGDSGMIYFWIRKDDLAARRFERCWMVLQCC